MHLNEAKIGLEIHIQLNTKRKLFCYCSTKPAKPNAHTCEVCLGMPGSKPMLNKKALTSALMLSLALYSGVCEMTRFDRKTYFYPDLPKNYQITQYNYPLSRGGYIQINDKKIRITRIQLEEDPGAIIYPKHIDMSDYSLIDYNRSGIPLCEVVTEPDFTSSKEVKKFLKQLISIVKHLKIYNSDKSFRVDTNVSVGANPRVEIKNIGSIRDVASAIEYEIFRQKHAIADGEKIQQETRRWNGSATEVTREKETEEDYGYIVDSDLPAINPVQFGLHKIFESMPELPLKRVERMMTQYNINRHQALAIVSEKELADLYENVSKELDPKFVASWISVQLLKVLNYNNRLFSETKLNSKHFTELLKLIENKKISERAGELLLRKLVVKPKNPTKLAEDLNLINLSEHETFEIIKHILNKQRKLVEQYRQGKTKILSFLIGQIVKESNGRADAKLVKKMVLNLL